MTAQSASVLTELLLHAQSPDASVRANAENQLLLAEERDFPNYLVQLSAELSNDSVPEVARQLAGLMLKNAISGVDAKIDEAKQRKWCEVPVDIADVIKKNAFSTVSSPCEPARGAACQFISKIAKSAIPNGTWPGLIDSLLALVVGAPAEGTDSAAPVVTDVSARRGGLTAYGYICEDLQVASQRVAQQSLNGAASTAVLPPAECNSILTGVATGMKDSDEATMLIATRALYHVLYFAYQNVENDEERAYLFGTIRDNLRYPNDALKQASWECAILIAAEYYEFLEPYMQELATLSLEAIQTGSDIVAIPAVEFWNNVCDEEIAIEAGDSTRRHMKYMSQAREVLLPVLFEVMTRQTAEDIDDNEWTLSMAAGTCVGLCAEVLRDEILDITLQFVTNNFGHADWQRREAAVFAYGSIMDGPSSERLQPLVQQSFETLCLRLQDESVAVRDTTAWTIGRIAKFHFSCVAGLLGSPESNTGLIPILLSKLNDAPRVAAQICFAVHEIAANQYSGATHTTAAGGGGAIDIWIKPIVNALYTVSTRHDAEECKLRTNSYRALGEVIRNAGPAAGERNLVVRQLFDKLVTTLEAAVKQHSGVDSGSGLIMDLVGSLELCIRASEPSMPSTGTDTTGVGIFEDDAVISRVFTVLSQVLYGVEEPYVVVTDTDGIQRIRELPFAPEAEDALMAINAVALACGQRFVPYAPQFCHAVNQGLSNRREESLCVKCIDSCGDLARSLQKSFTGQHCSMLVRGLYFILKDGESDVRLKPRVMQAIGDIAFHIGSLFAGDLEWSLDLLKQATLTRIEQGPVDSEDWVQFVCKLRESVLWAYEGIYFGLRSDNTVERLAMHISTIINFIYTLIVDSISSPAIHLKAVELLNDLMLAFPQACMDQIQQKDSYWPMLMALGVSTNDGNLQRQTKILERLMQRGQQPLAAQQVATYGW